MMDDAETRGFARGLAESARTATPSDPSTASSAAASAAVEAAPAFVVTRKRGREGVAVQLLSEQLGLEWNVDNSSWAASQTLGNNNTGHLLTSSISWFLADCLEASAAALDAALARTGGVAFTATKTWTEKMSAPNYFGRTVLMSCMQSLARLSTSSSRSASMASARAAIAAAANSLGEPERRELLDCKRTTAKETPRALFRRVEGLEVVPRTLLQSYIHTFVPNITSYTGTDDDNAVEAAGAANPLFNEVQSEVYDILCEAMQTHRVAFPGEEGSVAMHLAGRLTLASLSPEKAESTTVRKLWGTPAPTTTIDDDDALLFGDETGQQQDPGLTPPSPAGVAAAEAAAAAVIAAQAAAAIVAEGDFGIDVAVAPTIAAAPEEEEASPAAEEEESPETPKKRRRTTTPSAPPRNSTRSRRAETPAPVVPALDISTGDN
jgi:hypothetical protein